MTTTKILIRNGTIVTMAAGSPVLRGQDVLIDGSRIVAVGPQLDAAGADVIDATDAIVMPGLIDTHMHMWQYPWRGLVSRLWGFGAYAKVFWPAREVYEPQDTFDAIYGCGLEMIDHGITGVVDFFHGANVTPEHASAAMAAHRKTGQRVQLTYGATAAYDVDDRQAFERARVARVADFDRLLVESADHDLIEVGLGLLTPSDAVLEQFFEELQHARAAGARMSFHQNRPGEIRAIHERGLLGPDLVPVHSNTITDQELRWMAEAGTAIASTPQSEVSLGWSMTVMRRAIEHGVTLGMGVDTPGSLPVDMLGQLRLTYSLLHFMDAQVLRDAARAPVDASLDAPTADFERVLQTATGGGAHVLGREGELGVIREGALADVLVVRPRDRDAALMDPVAHLILSTAAASEVDTVIIGGTVRKRDGQLVGVERWALGEMNSRVRDRILSGIQQ